MTFEGGRTERWGSSRAARAAAVVGVPILLVGVLLTTGLLPLAVETSSVYGVASAASIPPWNTGTCNPNNPSPAALAVPVANPTTNEAIGSKLTVVYEFEVSGYTSSDKGLVVYLPSVKVAFPLQNWTKKSPVLFEYTLPAKNVAISGSGWTSTSLLTGSTTLTSTLLFDKAQKAYLTSSKEAVMANVSEGSLTLEFRWHWSFAPAGGGAAHVGVWSRPSLTASGAYLPSIFYPAPYVGVLSTTGSPVATGTPFNLTLNGSVGATSFRVVLEYTNGVEIQSLWENTTSRAVQNVSVPIAFPNGTAIPPGTYIVHVHDICESIVHIQPISVTAVGGPVVLAATTARPPLFGEGYFRTLAALVPATA